MQSPENFPYQGQPARPRACPNCQVALVITERSGIEIDSCPQCRGVWLDRGELDKVIEQVARLVPQQPQRQVAPMPQQMQPPPVYQQAPYYNPQSYDPHHNPHHDPHHDPHHNPHHNPHHRGGFLEHLFGDREHH